MDSSDDPESEELHEENEFKSQLLAPQQKFKQNTDAIKSQVHAIQNTNDYIEFQRIDGVSFNQFPNTFHKALTLELSIDEDDIIVCAATKSRTNMDFIPDYGECSVVGEKTGYRIVAKSFYPTIRANCTLTDGKYCF
eukprot:81369_1